MKPQRPRRPAASGPSPGGRPPRRGRPGSKPAPTPAAQPGERLQKILAHAGLGSRRACEEFILQGRVSVDGKIVRELGTRVDPARQKITVDGQVIKTERPVYFAVSKPKGYVSTNADPAGRPRVVDLLPEVLERVFTVGRLDEASTGLMILTNDGALAHKLAHPRFGVEKVYRALVAGTPTLEVLDQLVQGVWLAEGKARARRARIVGKRGDATVLELTLAEGKNREVRRVLAKLGHKVMSLTRIAVGPITLKGLKPGQARRLTPHEVELLRKAAEGLPVPTRRPVQAGPRRGPRRPVQTAPAPPAAPERKPRPPRPAQSGEPPRRKILGLPTTPPAARSRPLKRARRPPRKAGDPESH